MNVITSILFSIYFLFLLKVDDFWLYLIVLGIIFPYFENFLLFFIENKLKFKNKILHSFIILTPINILFSIIILNLNKNFFISFLFIFLGNLIHLFSDLTKSKYLYPFYPIKNVKLNLSISNYFDITPSIILIISNFLIIFLNSKLNILEKLVPLIILILYFISRYAIKKYITKNIFKDLDGKYKILIVPTLKINIWNIIRVAENNIYLFNLDIIKRKYLFVKYFTNNISKEDLETIEKSELFSKFKETNKFLYYQSYELKKDVKVLQVFDIKNFFNLFKREQVYYEAKYKNKKLVKEKIVL